MRKATLLAGIVSLLLVSAWAPQARSQDMSKGWISDISKAKSKKEAVKAWRDMGFGIFIHWTPAAVFQARAQGKELNTDLWGEWYMGRAHVPLKEYEKRVKTWNPKDFNPNKWAEILQKSGAKYVVFVAKHHDGFAMFNSKVNKYDIVHNEKFHRDVFGELCKALRARGLQPGFYYSHGTDWRNKHYFKGSKEEVEKQYWEKIVFPHLKTLCGDYGKQAVVWFDLGADKRYAKKCIDIVKKVNPYIMVSSRVGGGLGDFALGGDCDIPVTKSDKPWETCMTFDWHWDWYPPDRADKTASQLIRMLARIRSKGGNLLLNIGPDIRGNIPIRESVTLTLMGQWLAKNGDSIYGARLSPYDDSLPWGICTAKPGRLFMHLFKLPRLDYAFLPGMKSKIKKAYLLADPKKAPLKFEKTTYGYRIYLRNANYAAFNEADTVIAVEYDGALSVDPKRVLDLDLENRFIPALGKKKGGVSHGRTRVTPKPDSPGIEAPHYYDYAWKFVSPDSAISWACAIPESTFFFVKLKYANFTDKTLKANVTVGGKTVRIDLPPTPKNAYACFQTAICAKAFKLADSKNAEITFSLDKSSASPKLGEKSVRGLRKFMLEWVEVSTLNPPLCKGYGDTNGL